jgi:hypothetical protein
MNSNPLPQQLDIFADSRDVMLRNDVVGALVHNDAALAQQRYQLLESEYPQDPDLAALRVLIQTLIETVNQTVSAPIVGHADAMAAAQTLLQGVTPAAQQTMGATAAALWLRPRWSALAQRCAGLPFQSAHADAHAAALYLRGDDWRAAALAVQSIESWRRIPAPLMWMAQARYQLEGLDRCWPLLAELAWMAPQRVAPLFEALNDPLLNRLHKRFNADFEDAADADAAQDLAWFPAWLLTSTPALAPHLALAQAGQHSEAERGMRCVLDLLALERQGRHHDLLARRRSLRDLHSGLYSAYMATR